MKLYNDDCLEVMKELPDNSIDLILTDLPYGVTACKWDNVIPYEPMWAELKRIRKDNTAIALFGTEPFSSHLRLSNLQEYKYDWKYKKLVASNFVSYKYKPMKHIEDVIIFGKGKTNYYPIMQERSEGGKKREKIGRKNNLDKYHKSEFIGGITKNTSKQTYNINYKYPEDIQEFNNRNPKDRGSHPTQKPVALLEYLIKTYTLENEVVLDFTMGSGSTGVACVNTNRDFIGIELDKEYYKIAKERIDEKLYNNTS
jgi:site-specific DNA-methyltransferase (adenine-specific)